MKGAASGRVHQVATGSVGVDGDGSRGFSLAGSIDVSDNDGQTGPSDEVDRKRQKRESVVSRVETNAGRGGSVGSRDRVIAAGGRHCEIGGEGDSDNIAAHADVGQQHSDGYVKEGV